MFGKIFGALFVIVMIVILAIVAGKWDRTEFTANKLQWSPAMKPGKSILKSDNPWAKLTTSQQSVRFASQKEERIFYKEDRSLGGEKVTPTFTPKNDLNPRYI